MKRLSHKDFVIALGLVVAAIIIVTSIYFKDNITPMESKSGRNVPEKKIKPAAMVKKVLEKLTSKTLL